MKKSALLAALCLSLLGLVAPSPASADHHLVLTWPELQTFNPSHTPYVFHVDDHDGTGDLYADWNGHRVAIPHAGEVAMEFPADGASHGWISIRRCTSEGHCSLVAESPWLNLVRDIDIHPYEAFGPTGFRTSLFPLDGTDSVTWELRPVGDPDSSPLASGVATSFRQDSDGLTTIPLGEATGLVHGQTYSVHMTATGESASWGTLDGEQATTVRYDDRVAGRLSTEFPVVFPHEDGFRDRVTVWLRDSDPIKTFTLEVLDEHGQVVRTLKSVGLYPGNPPAEISWDGRVSSGRVVPGTYTLHVRGWDPAGNEADIRVPITVSDRRLVWRTWSRTFSARSTITATDVGQCSTLKNRGDGRLGFYSQTKCRRPSKSVVATQNGAYVGRSLTQEYRNLQVSVRGGKARGQRDAYLVLYYVNRNGEFDYRRQFDGTRGVHPGAVTDGTSFVHDRKTTRPYMIWSVGLSQGSRYDVDSYTVSLQRQVLN